MNETDGSSFDPSNCPISTMMNSQHLSSRHLMNLFALLDRPAVDRLYSGCISKSLPSERFYLNKSKCSTEISHLSHSMKISAKKRMLTSFRDGCQCRQCTKC